MLFKYLRDLRNNIKDEDFREILNIVERDIKVNRTDMGKRTSPSHFIYVCNVTRRILNV